MAQSLITRIKPCSRAKLSYHEQLKLASEGRSLMPRNVAELQQFLQLCLTQSKLDTLFEAKINTKQQSVVVGPLGFDFAQEQFTSYWLERKAIQTRQPRTFSIMIRQLDWFMLHAIARSLQGTINDDGIGVIPVENTSVFMPVYGKDPYAGGAELDVKTEVDLVDEFPHLRALLPDPTVDFGTA